MNKSLSFQYMLGLLQTDGSFSLEFKSEKTSSFNYRILPVVSFSQAEERLILLENLQSFFANLNIKSKISNLNDKTGRAPRLRVEGQKQVLNLLKEMDSCKTQLTGLKRLDWKIMKAIFSLIDKGEQNTFKGRSKILDLREHFHKPLPYPQTLLTRLLKCGLKDPSVKKIPTSNRKSIEDWEKRQGMTPGSTKDVASSLFQTIEQDFFANCEVILKNIENNLDSSLHPDYVSGMIDGNGSFSFDQGRPVFSFTMSTGNESTLLAIAHYFKDSKPTFYPSSGSQYYAARRKEVIEKIKEHTEKAPFQLKNFRSD